MRLEFRVPSLLLVFAVGCATSGRSAPAAPDTLDRIKSTKVVKLGYLESAVPFSFVGPGGTPTGYSVELCFRVVEGLGTALSIPDLKSEWVKLTAETRIDAVVDGTVDLDCGSTTATLSRQERVDFTNLTFVDGATMVSRVDRKLETLGDLSGKRVAVIPGTTTERLVRDALAKAGVTPQIVPVKQHGDGLKALDEHLADAYASDRAILLGLVVTSSKPTNYALINRYLSYEPYGLMLRRDPAFRLAVNRELAHIYRSGQISDIYQRWFGAFGPPSDLLTAMYALYALPE